MIDLSTMKNVRVDGDKKRAYVDPGATLADFDKAAQLDDEILDFIEDNSEVLGLKKEEFNIFKLRVLAYVAQYYRSVDKIPAAL